MSFNLNHFINNCKKLLPKYFKSLINRYGIKPNSLYNALNSEVFFIGRLNDFLEINNNNKIPNRRF